MHICVGGSGSTTISRSAAVHCLQFERPVVDTSCDHPGIKYSSEEVTREMLHVDVLCSLVCLADCTSEMIVHLTH